MRRIGIPQSWMNYPARERSVLDSFPGVAPGGTIPAPIESPYGFVPPHSVDAGIVQPRIGPRAVDAGMVPPQLGDDEDGPQRAKDFLAPHPADVTLARKMLTQLTLRRHGLLPAASEQNPFAPAPPLGGEDVASLRRTGLPMKGVAAQAPAPLREGVATFGQRLLPFRRISY